MNISYDLSCTNPAGHRLGKVIQISGGPEFDHYRCDFCSKKFRDKEATIPYEIKVVYGSKNAENRQS